MKHLNGASYDLIMSATQTVQQPQVRLRVLNISTSKGRTVLGEGEEPRGNYFKPHARVELLLGPCSTKFWTSLECTQANHEKLMNARQQLATAEAAFYAAERVYDAFIGELDASYPSNNADLQQAISKIREIDQKARDRRENGDRPALFPNDIELKKVMERQKDRVEPLVQATRDRVKAQEGFDDDQKQRANQLQSDLNDKREALKTAKRRLSGTEAELQGDSFVEDFLKKYLATRGVAAAPDELLKAILRRDVTLFELEDAPSFAAGLPMARRTLLGQREEYEEISRCSWLKSFNWERILESLKSANANIVMREGRSFICCTQNSQKKAGAILLGEFEADNPAIHKDDRAGFLVIMPQRVWKALIRSWDSLLRMEEAQRLATVYPTPENAHLRPAEAPASPATNPPSDDDAEGEVASAETAPSN
jgi:hypothetical protein